MKSSRYNLIISAVAVLLALVGCNSLENPTENSQYKKDNEEFVNNAEAKGYTKLLFLNAKHPIYYKVIKQHESEDALYPYQDSEVSIDLSGRLISGEVFQKQGVIPAKVSSLILGMQYALQSMRVGDTWEVVVPYELGYGPYKKGNIIQGYSTLIFNVTLVDITKR